MSGVDEQAVPKAGDGEAAAPKKPGTGCGVGCLTVMAGAVALTIYLMVAGGGEGPSDDPCTRAFIHDTAKLARCYQFHDTGVSWSEAVELTRQVDRLYGR